MAEDTPEQTLEELLAASFDSGQHGPGCWVTRLEDPAAKEFVAALEERVAQGRQPVSASVRRILVERFDVTIGLDAIRRHFKRDCRCAR